MEIKTARDANLLKVLYPSVCGFLDYNDKTQQWSLKNKPVAVRFTSGGAPYQVVYTGGATKIKPCRRRKAKTDKAKRERIKERDGYACVECGESHNLHVHHVVSRENGGTDDDTNLVTLCKLCHAKAHEGQPVYKLMVASCRINDA